MRISEPKRSSKASSDVVGKPRSRPKLKEPIANIVGTYKRTQNKGRLILPIEDGCVFIVSDQHYYAPSGPSLAHRASVYLAKLHRPWAIISNGDTLDLAVVSRWPASSFTDMKGRPTVASEMCEATERLVEYEALDFVKYLAWNLGNHDARFETRLAEHVPEYQGVEGFTLKDHFPNWLPAWRTDFANAGEPSELVVQHRFKGGMHAGQNNVLWSGTNYVTGHDHMLKAYSVTTTRGLFWGIHAGTMAPIDSPLFLHYTEDRPKNWQEGFPILWFRGGKFIGPELVHVTPDGRVLFRGEVLKLPT
jgi:hypothetical protein